MSTVGYKTCDELLAKAIIPIMIWAAAALILGVALIRLIWHSFS